jgi:CheY-like chemotaxis protein
MDMNRILIVEDDSAMRKLLRERLNDAYDIADTGDPTKGLSLALELRPKCILLDLLMPRLTGFELCKTLSSLSLTQLIPILVISGNPMSQYREFCANLGAKDYFQKPIDFGQLRARIAEVVRERPSERRAEVRVRLQVMVKLRGIDRQGKEFEELAITDDVSPSGFRCSCAAPLDAKSTVEVYLTGGGTRRRVGRAQVVHAMWPGKPAQQYGFHFLQKPYEWICC